MSLIAFKVQRHPGKQLIAEVNCVLSTSTSKGGL